MIAGPEVLVCGEELIAYGKWNSYCQDEPRCAQVEIFNLVRRTIRIAE